MAIVLLYTKEYKKETIQHAKRNELAVNRYFWPTSLPTYRVAHIESSNNKTYAPPPVHYVFEWKRIV